MGDNQLGFTWNAGDFIPLMEGRCRFLRAVSDYAPAVVKEIAALSNQAIGEVLLEAGWNGLIEPNLQMWPRETATALLTLTERRGLADGWARAAMALAVGDWAKNRPEHLRLPTESWLAIGHAFATSQQSMAADLAEPAPTIEVPSWNMHADWTAYEAEVLEMVRERLRGYRVACEDRARDAGWVPAPEKRPRGSGSVNQHFIWLALFQCRGWSYEHIANHPAPGQDYPPRQTAKAIEKACRDTAALIGLTRRSLPAPQPKFPLLP